MSRACLPLLAVLLAAGLWPSAHGANPPPSQVYYVPFPEDNQLAGYVGINTAAVDPLAVFVTFSASADNTVIYYDHWEDGYEEDITNPTQSTTQVFGDGNPANGYPPGNAGDLIAAGTIFSLRNYITSTTLQSVLDYDARDKVASFKPISLTKTSFPASTNTLLAGCVEVFEQGLWGTEYRVPVGVDMPTTTATSTLTWDADIFSYSALSIMAGAGGASVQIDANNDGTFEQTVSLAEGGTTYVTGVNTGARVVASRPVQVVYFSGRPTSNYQSRDTTLLPVYRWSSSYYAPVSTATTNGTTVFLYNPGTSAITVSYDYRSSTSAYTTATVSVPAGGNARVNLSPASGTTHYGAYKFYTTGANPPVFYAFSAVDAASGTTGNNQAYDGGFTLVGQPSLTTQVLVSLGIGRDPYSSAGLTENGNPVWITTAGNGHTAQRVYVDYNGDNAGTLTDPNGNKYDVHYDLRELQQQKLFDPDGDQSGMLVYVLNPNIKIAAAWAQDPTVATAGQPGLDVSTLIPPLREGDAAKGSSVAVDADGDGEHSAGDTLEYDIRVINTARTGVNGPFTVKDNLPADTTYVPGSTKYRYSVGGAWQAWVAVPDDLSGTAFPLDGAGYGITGTLGYNQQIQVSFLAVVDTYANLTPGTTSITNTGTVEVMPYGLTINLNWSDVLYGSIGNRVWVDTDGDGVQDSGEAGLNGVTVYADLDNDSVRDAGEPFAVTSGGGDYLLAGLTAGTYVVRVDAASVAAIDPRYGPTYDLDGLATGYVATVALAAAQDRDDADFGFRIGASVGDRVWVDRDGDGVQEAGEPGINGVRVFLDLNTNGSLDSGEPSAVTFGDGNYYIGNLASGTYSVRVDTSTLPSGATQTYDLNGTGTPHVAPATLQAAEHNGNLDFGYRGSLSIGDLVWEDINADALYTTPTVYNVYNGRIDINNSGAADNNDDGFIGTMRIVNGYVDIDNDASATTPDADDDGVFLGYAIINGGFDIDGNASITTADDGTATYAPEPGIANVRVYIDANGNGMRDLTEAFATTNASGVYSITNLFNGTYAVRVDTTSLPASLSQTYDLTSPVTDNQATVTLSGTSRTDADFGYRNDATLGDRVWNDMDNDGVQDAGEPGIEGVLVYIDADADGLFDQGVERFVVTDVNGNYTINNLAAGTYSVRIEISTLPRSSTQTYDFDGVGTAHAASRTLATSEDAVNVDFGYRSTASIGNFVWLDADADGVQDAGETGINGVRVYLDINGNGVFDGATEPSATTASGGAYTISGLVAGTYTARIDTSTLPGGMVPTYDLAGDLDHATTFMLSSGQVRTDVDFGYTQPVLIGDRVWNDLDADGVQDGGEPGLDGVTVTAWLASNNTVAATTTTAGGGVYSFPNLLPGTYFVEFGSLPGYNRTLADQGADGVDSDANVTTGKTPNVTLTSGQSNLTLDAGFYQPVTIGDFVWNDSDANGVQDGGETGLDGVSVTLYRPGFGPDGIAGNADDSTAVATTTSAGGGAYSFTSLPPGTYQVEFGTLAGYSRAPANQGGDDAIDSDPDAGTGLTGSVVLSAGTTDNSIDAGFYQPGAISGAVLADTDGNGTGDAPLQGVTLALLDSSGNPVDGDPGTPGVQARVTTTAPDGSYSFDNLVPGFYQVGETQPAGYFSVVDKDAGNPDLIGDQSLIAVTGGATNTGNDFIEQQAGSVSGFVLQDDDNDSDGDSPLANVEVRLTDNKGVTVATTFTGADGSYTFNNVVPGNYTIIEVQPSTHFTVGDGDTTDPSDDAPNTSQSDDSIPVGILPGEHDDGNLFIEELPAFITGHVYADTDNDGDGDVPIPGVTLTLLDTAGNPVDGDPNTPGVQVLTEVTDANGFYSFDFIAPGTYGVGETQPSGYLSVSDKDGGDPDEIRPISVLGGQTSGGNDFIEEQPGTVAGHLYLDTNGDGNQDPGEPDLAGVDVKVTDSNGAIQTVTSDANGNWTASVPPGSTTADLDETDPQYPSGFIQTEGTDPTTVTAVAGSTVDGGIDGFYQPGTVAGHLYLDTNGDGNQDPGEPDLAGVDVKVTDSNGAIQTVTSDANGNWTASVPPGLTTADIDETDPQYPSGFIQTEGTDPTTVTAVAGSTVDGGIDGFYQPGTVAGHLYLDTNGDGNQDPGEPDLAGVDVKVTDSNGAIQTVTSDANGNWTASVPPGSTTADLDETDPQYPSGSTQTEGTDPTTVTAVAGATVDGGIDGYFLPGAISGTVWSDIDNNGSGDSGIPNVTLILKDSNGDIVGTTVTLADGTYSFGNLPPGTYTVTELQPSGYLSVSDIDGSNPDLIGDVSVITVTAGATTSGQDFLERPMACPNKWSDWQNKWDGPTGGQTGPAQNPDGDIYSNLVEYAFCLPPDKGIMSPFCLDGSLTDPDAIDGVFRRTAGGATDVTYELQYIADLTLSPGGWTSIPLDPGDLQVTVNPNGTETVRILDLESVTGLTGGSGFVRMRVSLDADGDSVPEAVDVTEAGGWVDSALGLGCRTYNNPFLSCPPISATIDSVSGQDLVLASSGAGHDFSTMLTPGAAYYAEVVAGDHEGARFDITGAGVDSLSLALDANLYAEAGPHNTLTGPPPASLAGDQIVVRRHWTLGEMFPAGVFSAAATMASADKVQFLVDGSWITYWLYDDAGTPKWVRGGDNTLADQSGLVVPPGRGVFVNCRQASGTLTALGKVRANDFARPMAVNPDAVGGGYPVDSTSVTRAMATATGFLGSLDPKKADQFFVWKGDSVPNTNGYDSYFLLDGAPSAPAYNWWAKQGDADVLTRNGELLFLRDRSVITGLKATLPGYAMPAPWVP